MLADLQQYLMTQEVVFTAKSLSGWLKEMFSPEIDRERQQLEQYKRVGRDGLIAGVPAAEAKLDVVETLGAAGAPEGDPTMLGEPTFEDLEQAVAAGAQPEVGPASGSPAARGRDDDHDGDFGEEAPTEIFGEIDNAGMPVMTPAVAPPAPPRAPTGPVGKLPPRPPPAGSRPPTNRPADAALAAAGPSAAFGTSPSPASAAMHSQPAGAAEAGFQPALASPGGFSAQSYAPPGMDRERAGHTPAPSTHGANTPMPVGTPGAMPVSNGGPMGPMGSIPPAGQGQAKTLLGAVAPIGLPNYAAGYPPAPSGQQPAVYPGYPQQGQHPSQPQLATMPAPGLPGVGPMAQTPAAAMPGLGSPGMPGLSPYPGAQPMPGYASQPPYAVGPTPAVDQSLPPEGRKRSSIGRDVAIGVAIAGLVLGGFLAVKFLVLDSSDEPEGDTTASSIAKLRISMPNGPNAELFVDEKRVATVADNQEIAVTAGQREVKLVGPNGQQCKKTIQLAADQVTTVECKMDVAGGTVPPGPGSAGSAAGTGSGSGEGSGMAGGSGSAGAGSGSGSASAASGSGAGSGSGGTMVATGDKPGDKTGDKPGDKTGDKPGDKTVKPGDKTPAEKTAAEKAAAEKAAAEKVAAEKAAAEKARLAALEKAKKDKDKPPPDDPAAPTKGYVQISSKPSAKILVDGVDTGMSTPITGRSLALSPGKHKIAFQIGGDKYTFTVTVKAGETIVLDKNLQ
jgi:hypothetical protein